MKFISRDNPVSQIAKLLSLGGKRKGKFTNTWNVQHSTGLSVVNFDTDVLSWEDLFIDSANFDEVICDEIFLAERQDETVAAKAKELQSWVCLLYTSPSPRDS